MAKGWKAGRCQHVQVSELFSMEECDQAVMDFLVATEIRKSRPNEAGMEQAQWLTQVQGAATAGLYLFFCFLFCSGLSFF